MPLPWRWRPHLEDLAPGPGCFYFKQGWGQGSSLSDPHLPFGAQRDFQGREGRDSLASQGPGNVALERQPACPPHLLHTHPLLCGPCDVLGLFLSPTSLILQAGSELWKVWRCLLIPWRCPRLRGWWGQGGGGWPGASVLAISTSPSSNLFWEGDPLSNICPSPGQEWVWYPQQQLVGGCTLPPVFR